MNLRVDAWTASPVGSHLGRLRGELRAVLGQCREGRALPLRSERAPSDGTHRPARADARGLARLSAGCPPRPALRIPRQRALCARQGAPLQSAQAADRPLCQGAGRQSHMARRLLRLSRRLATRGLQLRPPRQRLHHAQMPGRRHGAHLGRRHPAAASLGRDRHLRSARQGHDGAPSRLGPAAARHLCRAGRPARHRPPGQARHHRRRAAARAGLLRRSLPGGEGAEELLGL